MLKSTYSLRRVVGLATLAWALSLSPSLTGQDLEQFARKLLVYRGDTLRYRILYPENYNPQQKYPLVVFLHGAGERGNDNAKQLTHGARLFLENANRYQYPAIVVFPQCPENSYWSSLKVTRPPGQPPIFEFPYAKKPTTPLALSIRLVDSLLRTSSVDRQRVYLSGLSMGGFGSFEWLVRQPRRFAAALPICGGGSLDLAKRYARQLPLWIFHGDQDGVVPVDLSRQVYQKLQTLGASVKYSEYAGVNHNSWDNAFAEPEFLRWMFTQKRAR